VLIEVFSDVVCPWCWLGKRRLERAIGELPLGDEIEVRWRAFQLDPGAPAQPQPYREVLARKYGSASAVAAMTRRLTDAGRAEGLDYRWDTVQRVNSFDAHRLLAWTGDTAGHGAKAALEERLFHAYFTEGANIADREQLAALAAETGLDGTEAARLLTTDGYGDEVRADRALAAELDIMGVPAFVLEGRDQSLVVPGAQEVETFRLVISRARERLAS
jgi:predicted DsbA family dithiol-disulfide isomerase